MEIPKTSEWTTFWLATVWHGMLQLLYKTQQYLGYCGGLRHIINPETAPGDDLCWNTWLF